VDVEKYALLCQQTSPKRWFGNMEMTLNCDVTKSTPNTNDHHMTLNQTTPHENFLRTLLYATAYSVSQIAQKLFGISLAVVFLKFSDVKPVNQSILDIR